MTNSIRNRLAGSTPQVSGKAGRSPAWALSAALAIPLALSACSSNRGTTAGATQSTGTNCMAQASTAVANASAPLTLPTVARFDTSSARDKTFAYIGLTQATSLNQA